MEDLKDKVAIVTGAGQGIGEAIALELSACGAEIAAVDMVLSRAETSANKIQAENGKAFAIEADVSEFDQVRSLVEKTKKKFGRIDILVNNVGISPKNKDNEKISTLEIDHMQWDLVLKVNLKSVFLCTQAVVKEMKKNKSGAILNISSFSGKYGDFGPPAAHYCASKAGVINFTIYTARELCQYGIRVNSIAPGTVETDQRKNTSEKYNKLLLNNIPMGRFCLPCEIAKAAAFLVSDSSSYITGEVLDVNGGILMD